MRLIREFLPCWAFAAIIATSCELFAGPLQVGVEIDFEDIDKRDVDILVGEFSSLVQAFKEFAVDENSILEQRIDQIFYRFDEGLECAADRTLTKAVVTFERSLPDFRLFRKSVAKRCDESVLRSFGEGGSLDQARFNRCIVRHTIIEKPVPFKAVSSGYAGLKEIANASYCGSSRNEGSADFEQAKNIFSHASIMIEVYDDLSEINGCDVSSATAQYECASRYYLSMTEQMKGFFEIDQAHINYQELDSLYEQLLPPNDKRVSAFARAKVLTLEHLDTYEKLTGELRRNYELAQLSRARRQAHHRKKVVDPVTHLVQFQAELAEGYQKLEDKYRTSCSLDTGEITSTFGSVVQSVRNSQEVCDAAIEGKRFADFVTSAETEICISKGPEMIEHALAIETRMKKECADASAEFGKGMMWEERQRNMGAF